MLVLRPFETVSCHVQALTLLWKVCNPSHQPSCDDWPLSCHRRHLRGQRHPGAHDRQASRAATAEHNFTLMRHHLLACRGPVLVDAHATSATLAVATLQAPPGNTPVASYELTCCAMAQPSRCITTTCTAINCLVPGLAGATQYRITAVALFRSGINQAAIAPSPASNVVVFTTPVVGAPALTAAMAQAPTTAILEVSLPAGPSFIWVCMCESDLPAMGSMHPILRMYLPACVAGDLHPQAIKWRQDCLYHAQLALRAAEQYPLSWNHGEVVLASLHGFSNSAYVGLPGLTLACSACSHYAANE